MPEVESHSIAVDCKVYLSQSQAGITETRTYIQIHHDLHP